MDVDEIKVIIGLVGSAIGGVGTFIVSVITARGKNSTEQAAVLVQQQQAVSALVTKNLDDCKVELKETRDLYHKCQHECVELARTARAGSAT